MPKTRRQVEADIGKRMSLQQHRKRESLEIMRESLLPPLEEATQSPPNVMLPPLEAIGDSLRQVNEGIEDEEGDQGLAEVRQGTVMGQASSSTRTIKRVSTDAESSTSHVLSSDEGLGGALQLGLGEPFELVTTTPSVIAARSTLAPVMKQQQLPPLPSSAGTSVEEVVAKSAAPPIPLDPPSPPPSDNQSRKKRSLSLSASLVRSKSEQSTTSAPPIPATPVMPTSMAPKMKKQRSLKKLFFPSSSSSAAARSDQPASSVPVPPVPALPRASDGAMSPISAMNRETDEYAEMGSSSTGNILSKSTRSRSKSFKSKLKVRPDLVISTHADESGEYGPVTPALTTASTDIHSAQVLATPEQDKTRASAPMTKEVSGSKSISKRFSLGNMSAAFKRKSVPNLSTSAAEFTSDFGGIPAVPTLPAAYRQDKGRSGLVSNDEPAQTNRSRTLETAEASAWPINKGSPLDRRRSMDSLPASESTFPPTILQLLPSPSITSSAAPVLPVIRDRDARLMERDRTNTTEYRDKRRGSRFDFDFASDFAPPSMVEEGVSPKSGSLPISPALASSEGACVDTSPAAGSSGVHSSAYHEDMVPGTWATEEDARSTESGQGLLDDPTQAEWSTIESHESLSAPLPSASPVSRPTDIASRSFFDLDDDDLDDELAETESTSIVHAQIMPVSPTTWTAPYGSVQHRLSSVHTSRVTQVEPSFSTYNKRQSVQALVMGIASVDDHGALESNSVTPSERGPQAAGIAEGYMRKSMMQAMATSAVTSVPAAVPTSSSSRRHHHVPRRDTEPVVKMIAPMVIDLRGQYARRFTQPAIRTRSMPAPATAVVGDAHNTASLPPIPPLPSQARTMEPTMVPLKGDSSEMSASTMMERRSSEELRDLVSEQTAIHIASMHRQDTESGIMSRSDSASSASTQVIPTTPSSLALLRMMEPESFTLDSDSEPEVEFSAETPEIADLTMITNDHTFEHDPEMDRLAAELDNGDVNVEVAISVSHSVLMGSTISASDIASMAHIASLVQSPQSVKSARAPREDQHTELTSAGKIRSALPDNTARHLASPIRQSTDAAIIRPEDVMSESSSVVLVDPPSIPPEWMADITPPTQDRRARVKSNLKGKAAKAVKAATYKGKNKAGVPSWNTMLDQPRRRSEHMGAHGRQSPSFLSASPHGRDSPSSVGSNGTGGSGGSTPKSTRFPSPEALFRLLHSPRSRRASADVMYEQQLSLTQYSSVNINEQQPSLTQYSPVDINEPTANGRVSHSRVSRFESGRQQAMTHPVHSRPLPHIEGLPRACEVERQEESTARWAMSHGGTGLELSSSCFDALGLDLDLGEGSGSRSSS